MHRYTHRHTHYTHTHNTHSHIPAIHFHTRTHDHMHNSHVCTHPFSYTDIHTPTCLGRATPGWCRPPMTKAIPRTYHTLGHVALCAVLCAPCTLRGLSPSLQGEAQPVSSRNPQAGARPHLLWKHMWVHKNHPYRGRDSCSTSMCEIPLPCAAPGL
jgi:hypothetical protein